MRNLNLSSKSSYHAKKSLQTAEKCRSIGENYEISVEKRTSGRMIESERRASYRFYFCEVFLQKMPLNQSYTYFSRGTFHKCCTFSTL